MSTQSATTWEAVAKHGETQAEAEQVAPGIYVNRGIGNAYLVTTPEGDVLVNAGTMADAKRGRPLFDKVSSAPLRYAITTQSHGNQYGGLKAFMRPETKLITHRLSSEIRAYWRRLWPYYSRRNAKLWKRLHGEKISVLEDDQYTADILVDDRYEFTLGGRRFEILSTPGGETHDSQIVWLPNEKIALIGNLFGPIFVHQPNLNTVRGDKIRSALEFIDSIKRLRALEPELLLTGHQSVAGKDVIKAGITRIIDAVQWLHDKTVEGMNEGKGVRQLMREIQLPDSLKLGEGHGKAAWNVRAIWTEYSGWFDYDEGTTGLYDVPRTSIDAEIAALVGGVKPLAEAARKHVDAGRPLEALHFVEIALAAEPKSQDVLAVKKAALTMLSERAEEVGNLSERMWLREELAAFD